MNAYALDSSSKGSFRTLSCGLFLGLLGLRALRLRVKGCTWVQGFRTNR